MKPSFSSILRSLIVAAVVLLAGFLFLATPGRAQAYACTTISGGGHNWSESSKWTDCNDTTPQPGDTVAIMHNVIMDIDANVAALTVSSGALLTVGTEAQTLAIAGDLLLSGGYIAQSAPGSVIYVDGNITIAAGSEFEATTTVSLSGNFANNGTFFPNGGTVEFNGSLPQTLTGTAAATTTFYDLTINNTGETTGVSLSGQNVVVTNTLTFFNGRLTLGSNDLTMASTAGAVVGVQLPSADQDPSAIPPVLPDPSKMVVADASGRMCRVYTASGDPYTFPVGDATQVGAEPDPYDYSPAILSYNTIETPPIGSPALTTCVRLTIARHPQFPPYINNYLNRYWTITMTQPGSLTFNYTASLHYVQNDFVGTSEDSMRGMKYSDGKWYVAKGVEPTANYIFPSNQSSFSDFTAGNRYATAVSFEYFRAAKVSGGVELAWKTSFENNVSGFNLYRREAGQNDFVRLNSVVIPSGGDPNGSVYTYLDASALAGRVYEYKIEENDTLLNATGAAFLTYYPHVLFLSLLRR